MKKTKNEDIKIIKNNSDRKISVLPKIQKLLKNRTVALAAAAVLIVFLIAVKGFVTGSYTKNTAVFTDEANKKTLIAVGEKILSEQADGELSGEPVRSADGKTTVFLTYSKNESSSYYTLYAVRNKRLIRITNNISSSFTLSSSGNAVCYTDREGSLKLNSISGQDSLVSETADEYCVSPDGKTVIFSSYDESGLSYNLYCCKKGSVSEIGTGLVPVGVENNAENIYACDTEFKTLYSVSPDGKEKNKISEITDSNILFNSDCTQIIFNSDSGTYICFSGSVRKIIYPFTGAYPVFSDDNIPIVTNEKHGIKIYPTDDFTDMYYYLAEKKTLSYIDSNCARTDIFENVTNVSVSSDLKYVYFTDSSESLYMIKNKKEPVCVKNEVSDFNISNDGKFYTFTNSSGAKEFAKNKKSFCTENNVKFNAITSNGKILFTMPDKQNCLFEILKSGKTKQISDSVSSVGFDKYSGSVIYFETDKKGGTVCKIIT